MTGPAERYLSLFLADMTARQGSGRRPAATILAYHRVAGSGEDLVPDAVTRDAFAAQMRFLRDHAWHVTTVARLADCLASGRGVPEKTVVVTFDDGYRDTFLHALPVLRECGFRATFFLATHYIGGEEPFPWLAGTPGADRGAAMPMSWEDARELHAAGMELGSHTSTHPFLPLLDRPEIEAELRTSRDLIERNTGAPVHSLALPFSFPLEHRTWPCFRKDLAGILARLDYRCNCTMQRGHVDGSADLYALKRMPVGRDDDLRLFIAKLEGCYAWTRHLQSLYQHCFKNYAPVRTARGRVAGTASQRD